MPIEVNQSTFTKEARVQPTYGALPATGFIRLTDLRPIVGFSDSTLWRRVRAGSFPQPIRLSVRCTAWRVEEIRAWIAAQGQAVEG